MINTQLLAQKLILPDNTQIDGPVDTVVIGGNTIGALLNRMIPFIIAFAGISLLLVIISGGFALLTSAGDAKKMEAGKHQITNGVIGFIIIILAYWLVQIAGNILGIGKIGEIFK